MATQTPVWFITAASSGFGKYIALEALSRGHKVIASARNTARIQDLKEKGAITVTLDVTSPQPEIEKVAKQANDTYGYINHLVNAAGYLLAGAIEETSPEEDLAIFKTNVLGLLNVSKAFLPYMRATSGHRTVANLCSMVSWIGRPGYGLYVGTKWACSGISESMYHELKPLGINVTAVEPGAFRTGFLNTGVLVSSKKTLPAYDDGVVGEMRAILAGADNHQPGDVIKGSKVVVDILTKAGAAEGKDVPIRIVLGSDSFVEIRDKIDQTTKLLNEWEGVSMKTEHE